LKTHSVIEKVPASGRKDLDFLGQVCCPIKDRVSRAWQEFERRYNAGHETALKGVVPMGGCGVDSYYNISSAETPGEFPGTVTDMGYGEFFTGNFLESPEKLRWFVARPPAKPAHPLFGNLDLRDPKGVFTIFGAMPYVLLVNHRRLKGRSVPRRIADLTREEYAGSLGVGYAPEDISEILLLEIWKEQGEQGIRALARNIGFTGRIAEMAAEATANRDGCCVFCLSWFFAHAVPGRDYLEIIWPEDGALFNPLYAVFKKEETEAQKACGDFLFGPELGGSLAQGWFAHINPDVEYAVPPGAGFRWVGWDYIYEQKITRRVREIEAILYDEMRK
jgi:ABC-type Fe3+ transport system substrate-binding protein